MTAPKVPFELNISCSSLVHLSTHFIGGRIVILNHRVHELQRKRAIKCKDLVKKRDRDGMNVKENDERDIPNGNN